MVFYPKPPQVLGLTLKPIFTPLVYDTLKTIYRVVPLNLKLISFSYRKKWINNTALKNMKVEEEYESRTSEHVYISECLCVNIKYQG